MTARRVRIIGAGLAGLSAAVELAAAGYGVDLSEAGPRAGGRCRSYLDPQLGLTIDNGNHLVLSGNSAVHAYLDRVGAGGRVAGPPDARFGFVDLVTGDRFTVRPNDGPLPWWIFAKGRRVPGTRAGDYLRLTRLLRPPPGATVGDVVPTCGPLWERLIEPVLLAALNTPAAEASAGLASAVIRETLAKGGQAYRPQVAVPTLAAAFVDPALDYLSARGATVRFGRRLTALRVGDEQLRELVFADGIEPVAEDEAVILAVPAPVAATLLPGLPVPTEFAAIVSLHFAVTPPAHAPAMLGVLGGTSEWIFTFPDRISVTISAADRLVDADREALAGAIWAEVAVALDIAAPLPPWQVVKERRATFAATVAQDALRPPAATRWRNLSLAGDWTQTGLPATIEGAVRSGVAAAGLAIMTARL
ncbi:MAG: hydroxysqualene dehydroxylase HpnE [Janthinobacterium lividum]